MSRGPRFWNDERKAELETAIYDKAGSQALVDLFGISIKKIVKQAEKMGLDAEYLCVGKKKGQKWHKDEPARPRLEIEVDVVLKIGSVKIEKNL